MMYISLKMRYKTAFWENLDELFSICGKMFLNLSLKSDLSTLALKLMFGSDNKVRLYG